MTSKNLSFEQEFNESQTTYIHETSIIGPSVKLANGVKIGPYCILVGNITIGKNTNIKLWDAEI